MIQTNKKLEEVNCNYCGSDDYKIRYIKDGYKIVQCNNCSLVYVNPRLSQAEIYNLYDEDYFHGRGFDESVQYRQEFDKQASSIDLMNWDISTIKEFITKRNSSELKMLDIGCGMGLFLWKAKDAGFQVEGLELSPYACKFVESLGIPVSNSSIDNAKIEPGSYDSIVMREVIEHLLNPMDPLIKVYRSLKNGGVLFLTTGNYSCPERRLKGKDWSYFRPEGHLNVFSHKTMRNFLLKAGFKKVYVTNQGDLLMNILLKYKVIDPVCFKPKNIFKRIIFEKTRALNHFISSGMRVYAIK